MLNKISLIHECYVMHTSQLIYRYIHLQLLVDDHICYTGREP